MSDLTPDVLAEKYPALRMLGAYADPALFEQSYRNPVVEQLRELMDPHRNVMRANGRKVVRRERELSPWVHNHPIISAGIDRAREYARQDAFPRCVEDYGEAQVREWEQSSNPHYRDLAAGCRMNADFTDTLEYADSYPPRVQLNTGRPPQQRLSCGREYSDEDLHEHERHRQFYEGPHVLAEIDDARRAWELDRARVYAGGSPVKVVTVHSDDADWGTWSYPVPVSCSPERRVRLLAQLNLTDGPGARIGDRVSHAA